MKKIKTFSQGLVSEGRLLVVIALMLACIACFYYIEHHAVHPAEHIGRFLTK